MEEAVRQSIEVTTQFVPAAENAHGGGVTIVMQNSFAPGTDRRTIAQGLADGALRAQRELARGTAG